MRASRTRAKNSDHAHYERQRTMVHSEGAVLISGPWTPREGHVVDPESTSEVELGGVQTQHRCLSF